MASSKDPGWNRPQAKAMVQRPIVSAGERRMLGSETPWISAIDIETNTEIQMAIQPSTRAAIDI